MNIKFSSFKFDARTRFFIIAAACFLISVVYYRGFYHPRAAYLNELKDRYVGLSGEYGRLKSSMPDIKAEQEKLALMKKEYEDLFSRVAKSEKALPKNVHVPDILKFLVMEKDAFGLKVVAVKSRSDKAQDVPLYTPPPDSKQKPISHYMFLPIDMEVFASFDNITSYIGNIEAKLPYQRVSALQIDMQKTSEGRPECFLTILSILGRGEEKDVYERIKMAADPFRKKERPRDTERLAGAELSGIIWKKGAPYAIISGSLYKVGDSIKNKKIIKIGRDSVILEEEDKLFELTMGGKE